LTPRPLKPSTHWIGGCVGPRTSLHDVERRKILHLLGFNCDTLAFQPTASRYTDYAILAPEKNIMQEIRLSSANLSQSSG
jgi:hypothetical protein